MDIVNYQAVQKIAKDTIEYIKTEISPGMSLKEVRRLCEEKLHKRMTEIVSPEMTFEEMYYQMNDFIRKEGYINLDFMGNLGHSIVRKKEDRIYIEKGNRTRLGDVQLFTFEPHISISGLKYGYKRENIYYFDKGGLKEL